MADVLSSNGVKHGSLNRDRKKPSSKSERYTELLHLLRVCRNTILETTDELRDITDPGEYISRWNRKRNGRTELYYPIPPKLLRGAHIPDPMVGVNSNWKVIIHFYEAAEKEFLQKIDTKIAETDSLRQVVSIIRC